MLRHYLMAGSVLVCLSAWIVKLNIPVHSALLTLLWVSGIFLWLAGYGQLFIGSSPAANFTHRAALIYTALALAVCTPPVLSKDVYIYLLQGKLAWQGITTYTDGSLNFAHSWVDYVEPKWRDCPNHYGAVPMLLFCLAASASSVSLAMLILKLQFVVAIYGAYLLLKAIAQNLNLSELSTNQVVAAYMLNPVLLLQGLGQMHVDILSSLLVLLFIYGITSTRYWWLAPVSIGLLGATKFLLFPVFCGLYLVYHAYQWRQKQPKLKQALVGLGLSVATIVLCYAPIWQGIETISHPLAYHNKKEPVKSVVELLSYAYAYVQNPRPLDTSATDPLLAQKIAAGKLVAPYLKLIAILMAGWIVLHLLRKPAQKDILLAMGSIVLLVFILYSPVMHPWYFLLVLPFFAFFSHERHIWLYLVITFGLCNIYELGPLLHKPWGPVLTIGGTVISVFSYFIGIRKLLE